MALLSPQAVKEDYGKGPRRKPGGAEKPQRRSLQAVRGGSGRCADAPRTPEVEKILNKNSDSGE